MALVEQALHIPVRNRTLFADHGSGTTPLFLKLVTLMAAAYALLPSVGVTPVAVEGFEAAVTTAVNQPFWAPSEVQVPPYLYATRPGEFFLYELSMSLLPGDALLHGQVWSLVAYAAGLLGVVLMATRAGFGRVWVAALAYFLLFDVASNVAQASSSNLAMGFVALGGGLFTLRHLAAKVSAVLALAFAIFCRLDSVALVPAALSVSLLTDRSFRSAAVAIILGGLSAAGLALLFLSSAGVSLFDALGDNKGVAFQFNGYAVKNLILTLFPWTIIPPLFGVTWAQARAWRTDPLLAVARTLIVLGPMTIMSMLYMGKMETPRFLASASPFLALGTALLIEAVLRSERRVKLGAVAMLLSTLLATWALREPGMANDGFRYRWAVYLTPYERFREKQFLAKTSRPMFEDALELSCAECRDQNLIILATGWRPFNEVIRQLVLRGAKLEAVTSDGGTYRFSMNDRMLTVRIMNAAGPALTGDDLAYALRALRSNGRVAVVDWNKDVVRRLLRSDPSGQPGYSARYDRHENSSAVSAHFPAAR